MPPRRSREDKLKAHASMVKTNYGITGDEYWATYKFQGGRCAICMIATGRARRLAVDHNHKCGGGHDPKKGCPECVRGLLCSRCNRFLGLLGDDPRALERAIRYVTDPPFQILRREKP